MKKILLYLLAVVILGAPAAVFAAWQGAPGTPPNSNTNGPIWLQTGTPSSQTGNFRISGDAFIGNDVYITTNSKAIRVDGTGTRTLNVGNWNTGSAGQLSLQVYGNLSILNPSTGADLVGTLSAPEICLNGSCISAWPSAGTDLWQQSGSDVYYDAGNVGVGDADPDGRLVVLGNTGGSYDYLYFGNLNNCWSGWSGLIVSDSDASNDGCPGRYIFGSNGADVELRAPTGNISLSNSGGEVVRVTSAGNVGIGTTSPSHPLHVVGVANGYALTADADGGAVGIRGIGSLAGVRGYGSGSGAGTEGNSGDTAGTFEDSAGVRGYGGQKGVYGQGLDYGGDFRGGEYGVFGGGSTHGVWGQGGTMGGYFVDTNGTSLAEVASAGYGIWAQGDTAGAYFEDDDGTWARVGNAGRMITGNGEIYMNYASDPDLRIGGMGEGGCAGYSGISVNDSAESTTTCDPYIFLSNGDSTEMKAPGSNGDVILLSGNQHRFYVDGSEIMTLDSGNTRLALASGYYYYADMPNLSSGDTYLCALNGSGTGEDSSGGARIGRCHGSTIRIKDDVRDLTLGLDAVLEMRPRSFFFKNEHTNGRQVGFIAEEMEKISPMLIGYDEEGLPATVRYDKLTSVLAKAIQDLKKENDGLRAELEDLKSRMDRLEAAQ